MIEEFERKENCQYMFYLFTHVVSFFVMLLGLIHESNGVMQLPLMETACSQKLQANTTEFWGLAGFTMSCVNDLVLVAKISPAPRILCTF